MTLSAEIVDPRRDPEPSGWSDFRRRANLHPVWDYGLLRAEAWTARNPPVLAVVREHTRVVAALSVMVCRSWRDRAFAAAPSARTRQWRPRWAEVYLPLMSGHQAVVLHESLDAEARNAALRLVERTLADYLGPGLLGVVYRAMTEDVAAALHGRGRISRRIDPTAVMPNRWEKAERWHESLAPSLRQRMDEIAHDDTIDVTTGSAREDLDVHELTVLLNAHRARQDERAWNGGQRRRVAGLRMDTRSPIAEGYLDLLVRRPDVVTRTYRDRAGRLLAFGVLTDNPVSPAVHHWADLPRRDGGRSGLYLDFYALAVRHVVEHGRPELTAGRTLLDSKSALGFGTRDLHTVAVPRPVMGR